MNDTYRRRRADSSEPVPLRQQSANRPGPSYRRPPPPPSPPQSSGFSVRGAADHYSPPDPPRRDYQSRPPQSNFTFEASGGPQAPRFPEEQPQHRPNRQPARDKQKYGGRNQHGVQQRGGQQGRRFWPKGPRGPKPAHARELLSGRTDRETTPEQLAGMNSEHRPRYVEYISSDEESEDGSDYSHDENGAPRKRAKTDSVAEPARPKWSNPDPYSVLPPTDLGIGPKKDIVQTIRKSKVDRSGQVSAANAVKENADFIGFDNSDDEEDLEDGEMVDDDDDAANHEPALSAAPTVPHYDTFMPTDEDLMREYSRDFNNDNDKKRKRDDESSGAAGILPAWRARVGFDAAPWYRPTHEFTPNKALCLHKEVIDFFEFVRPQEHERNIRSELVDRVERVVQGFKGAGQARVKVSSFGSFASGLYLPVGDMDLVACSAQYLAGGPESFCQTNSKLRDLGRHLERSRIVKPGSLICVTKAKVPIIKFRDDVTGIKVDISFENDSGFHTNRTVDQWKKDYPDMPVLVAIIKQMLAMRDLNEVMSGGIGGFSIICLVVSMLQHVSPDALSGMDRNTRYAHLLLHFLDLYGNQFDVTTQGIEMVPPRRFRKVGDWYGPAKINPERLTIIDPNKPENDICGGSRNIAAVFACFRKASSSIKQTLNAMARGKKEQSSILECVLGGNYSSFFEQWRVLDWIDKSQASFGRPVSHASNYYREWPSHDRGYRPSYRAREHDQPAGTYSSQYNNFPVHGYSPTHALPQRPPPPPPILPPGPPGTDQRYSPPGYLPEAHIPQTQGNLPTKAQKVRPLKHAPKQPKQPQPQPSTTGEKNRKNKKKKKPKAAAKASSAVNAAAKPIKSAKKKNKKKDAGRGSASQ